MINATRQRRSLRSNTSPGAIAWLGFDISHAGRVVTSIAAQTAAVTGLLYYFGRVDAQAFYEYFGVTTSMLELTTTDYLVRSVGVAVPPLVLALASAALLLSLLYLLSVMLRHRSSGVVRLAIGALLATAAALTTAGTEALAYGTTWHVPPAGRPLLLALGLALGGAGLWLARSTHAIAVHLPWSLSAFGAAVAVLALFWSWTLYARDAGSAGAEQLVQKLGTQTAVSVYTTKKLVLSGPGLASPIHVGDRDSAYQYRYDGLRLLALGRDRWFLIPSGWRSGRDSVFVIPVTDDIRMNLIAPKR